MMTETQCASEAVRRDERPQGWGICRWCGKDCDEADYDEQRRSSIHAVCEAQEATANEPDEWERA